MTTLPALVDKAITHAKKIDWLKSIENEKLYLPPIASGLAKGTKCMVRVAKNLREKPPHGAKRKKDPFAPPFEDGPFVTELTKTHNVLLNKYNLFERHILITTKEFEDQESELTLEDFEAAWKAMSELDGLVYFNKG